MSNAPQSLYAVQISYDPHILYDPQISYDPQMLCDSVLLLFKTHLELIVVVDHLSTIRALILICFTLDGIIIRQPLY